jgi:ubiquinone/menaquinone biosynthesis C-methylase UbiE
MSEQTRDDVRTRYAQDGARYDSVRVGSARGAVLTHNDLALFREMLPELPPQARVVEVGAGTGRFTLPMLERGGEVIATDVNESLLAQLRSKLEARGLGPRCQVRREDVFHLSFETASLDFVYGIHIIPRFGSLEDQRLALVEIARTLKPGGRLLFNFRNRSSLLYGRLDRKHAATPEQIREILREGGLRIDRMCGKWLLNGRLVDLVGPLLGSAIAAVDRRLWSFRPLRAWDVFVLATRVG